MPTLFHIVFSRLVALALVLLVFGSGSLAAQTRNLKTLLRDAGRAESTGLYEQAAADYASAYKLKSNKEEYALQAAENYYLVRNYDLAAQYFLVVAGDTRSYPLAGLKLARALKQSGRFDEATAAYRAYLDRYRGDDKDIIRAIVEQELLGGALASAAVSTPDFTYKVSPLGTGINTSSAELAPMPLAASALYYLSDKLNGRTRMYRSDRQGDVWGKGYLADQFPVVANKNIGAGALSPSGDRFYFGLCEADAIMSQPTAKCQLYVIVQKPEGGWTSPLALPSYINTADATTTQPFVYQEGNREILLFASDRVDGFGGMDLYRTERFVDSEATDFTFPENLGTEVNSVADEVTPYYSQAAATLYFSSNGRVGFGGFDVFATQLKSGSYTEPRNLLSPVNSTTDDYYFSEVRGAKGAVVASNRMRADKANTTDDDLYAVEEGAPTMPMTVQVIDSATVSELSDVAIAAFQITEGGEQKLLASELSPTGYFTFEMPLGAQLALEVQRIGYRRQLVNARVPLRAGGTYQLPRVAMARLRLSLADVQQMEAQRTGAPVERIPVINKPVSVPPPAESLTSPTEKRPTAVAVATPVDTSRTYRIQLEALLKYNEADRRYRKLANIGEMSSTFLANRGLYRIFVGEFASLEAANAGLSEAQAAGFKGAFVVFFTDGEYGGMASR